MEFVADGMDSLELGVCDLDAFLIEPRIDVAFDFQAGVGRRRGDQFDHCQAVGQRATAPVLGNVAELSSAD